MIVKNEITSLLESTKRDGIEKLIAWLNASDFYAAPASTKYHGNYIGGLATHSLNVYYSTTMLNNEYKEKERYSEDTVIIAALLHDVCKIDTYSQDSEKATEAQLKYLWDLVSKSGDKEPEKEYLTKAYATKLIDYYKNGRNGVNADRSSYPEFSPTWKYDDKLPMGHGEKSVYLVQKFIQLTETEALAIRWHQEDYAKSDGHSFEDRTYSQAVNLCSLIPLIHTADYLVSLFVDKKV